MAEEGSECLGAKVCFSAVIQSDAVLELFGDQQMIRDMQKVFFADGPNALGHSYAHLMRGPGGGNDFQDIIALLRNEPWSKRAVLTLCGQANGKVPCLNVIQFLVRDRAVQVVYFARGQDIFRKFYADGLCVASMARTVADGLNLAPGKVTGFIGSSHIYHADLPAIRKVLKRGRNFLTGKTPTANSGPRGSARSTSATAQRSARSVPSRPPVPLRTRSKVSRLKPRKGSA